MTQARRTIVAGALAASFLAAWFSPSVLPPLLAQEGGDGGDGEEATAPVPAVLDITLVAPTGTAAAGDGAADPLAARLGGTRAGFEAVYSEPRRAADAAVRYAVRGYGRVAVTYAGERVVAVALFSDRPRGAPRDEPAAADWSVAKAEALARRFLPADVELGDPRRRGDRLVARCTSAALAAAAGDAGCRVVLRLSGEDRVWAIRLAVAEPRAASDATPTAEV